MLPENCSFSRLMISFVPTLIGALIRILNPRETGPRLWQEQRADSRYRLATMPRPLP
jgi:hypothetical protein